MAGQAAPNTATAAFADFSRFPMMGAMRMDGLLTAQADLMRVMDESAKAWLAMAQQANDAGTRLASDLRGAAPGEVASLCGTWLQQSTAECTMANARIAALWGDFCTRAMSASLGGGLGNGAAATPSGATASGATASGQAGEQLPKTSQPATKAA
jgi:hypothetical protein